MKKLGPIAYRTLFFKHLWRFLQTVTTLRELQSSHAIAVSGGADSMALLWVANVLHKEGKIGPVRALFVHHHTRDTQDEEMEMVRGFCLQEGIPVQMLHLDSLVSGQSNFEEAARKARRGILLTALKGDEKLWLGHHIDDSYEWNMMQRHRSNSVKSMLGIPVRNGPIIRPFQCVTRKQIRSIAKFEGIPFRNDPSNKDISFDRNYIRLKVIPSIKKRYPRYLRHYTHVANFSAMMLNLSVIERVHGSKIYVFEQGALLEGLHFSEFQIQELIHAYSHTNRGEIISQIIKMQRAIDNGKKGPFHFSGGVEAYSTHHQLMIYRQGFKNDDQAVSKALALLSLSQLSQLPTFTHHELEITWSNLLKTSDAMSSMPGLVLVLESDSCCKTLNTSVYDSLFPLTSEICKQKGLRFMTVNKCLDVWKNKKEKLPKKLRLLPLWNLANLFPSQE